MMNHKAQILLSLLFLLLAVFSFFILGKKYSVPEAYQGVISSIDKKTSDALRLTGTSTVASAGVTLLPDDIATPVAEKLADYTQYFLVALCVLYAEKYLLPIIGLAVFKLLIPAFSLLMIARLFERGSRVAGALAFRILTFATIIWLAIPVSIRVSDTIYSTYRESINDTIKDTENLTQDISLFSDSNGTTFVERATNLMSSLVEALAVTIATSCLIPILVLVFFIWLAKLLIGVTLPSPLPAGRPLRQLRIPGNRDKVEEKEGE